jgi:hypothetical protein
VYPSPVNDAKAADRAQILRNSEPLGGGRDTDHYHARAWEAVLGVGPLTLSCPRGRFHRREKEGPVSSSEWFDHTVTANSARCRFSISVRLEIAGLFPFSISPA